MMRLEWNNQRLLAAMMAGVMAFSTLPISTAGRAQAQTIAAGQSFEIGSIPWLDAVPGQTLSVQLTATHTGTTTFSLAVDSTPAPKGPLKIDPKGLLTFTPDLTDRFQVTASVTAKVSGYPDDTQQFEIRIYQPLPPQAQLIAPPNQRAMPNPTDTAYLLVTQPGTAVDKVFNGSSVKALRNVTLSAKKLAIGAAPDVQTMARFINKTDIDSIDIYAETVSVTGAWPLPASVVRIWCRELRFEDNAAAIVTTPLPFTAKSSGAGANGQAGGSIEVHAQTSYPQNDTKIRFDTSGGRGQDAGAAAARPGDGGPGGKFSSTLAALQKNWLGGGGAPGMKTNLAGSSGVPGTFAALSSGDAARWLAPQWVGQSIAYARDAFRNGNSDFAQTAFAQMSSDLQSLTALPADVDQAFDPQRTAVAAELEKLNANRDFFGNPGTWAPPISLQVTMALFTDEVNASFRTMYLASLLKRASDGNKKDITATRDAITLAQATVAAGVDAIAAAQSKLVSLASTASDLAAQERSTMDTLNAELKRLEAQATPTPPKRKKKAWWKKALNIVGTVAQFIPVAQPLLGIIGKGITFAIQPNINNALALLPVLPGFGGVVSSTFDAIGTSLGQDARDFDNWVSSLKQGPAESTEAYVKRVAANMQSLNTRAGDLRKSLLSARNSLKSVQAPAPDIQAQFDALKANDPALKSITDQIEALNQKKQQLTAESDEATGTIATKAAEIEKNLAGIASLGRALDDKVAVLDQPAQQFVQEMDRSARERLFRFSYLLQRAYEYRMLRPYPFTIDLSKVSDKILAMIDAGGFATQAEDFASVKAVYLDSIRGIVDLGIQELIARPAERTVPLIFSLPQAQLAELNSLGQTVVDLNTVIAPADFETNRLLSDLKLDAMTASFSSPTGCCRIRLEIQGESSATRFSENTPYAVSFSAPALWGGVYDVATGRVDNESISNAQLSFLAAITGRAQADLDSFVRPPADMRIRIRRIADPVTLPATITSVTFSAKVDYTRSNTQRAQLTVQAPDRGTPFVSVAERDLAGLDSGRGRFIRTFQVGSTIHVQAEPKYGEISFVKWVDGRGLTIGTSSAITLQMTSARTVKPVYTEPASDPDLSPSPVPVFTVQDAVANPGIAFDSNILYSSKGYAGAAAQIDCAYDKTLTFNTAKAGDALLKSNKSLTFNVLTPGTVRLVGAGFDLTTIPDGLFGALSFTLPAAVPSGFTSTLSCSNALVANATGGQTMATATPGTIALGGCSCDLTHDGSTDIRDIAASIRQVLGQDKPGCDLNGDALVNVGDTAIVVSAVLGKGCPLRGAR